MVDGKISVIMSVYNCESYICEAIDSILAQTYSNWQMIICDDASNDKTRSIIKEYCIKNPGKIIVLHNNENMKLAYSLNRCLEIADGEFVARMDGDDISVATRFKKQITYLRQHPEVDLVGTAMQRFDDSGLADLIVPVQFPDKYSMRYGNPFCHATIMTYKRVYDILEGYTVAERTNRGQDYDLWFRFFYHGFVGHNIQEPLYLVREDINAIRRRTFKVRYNAFKTTVYGFNLLGFPKKWLISAAIGSFKRAIVPYPIVLLYRKYQKMKHESSNKRGVK